MKRLVAAVVAIILTITIYHPERHAKHYEFIKDADVLCELVPDETMYKRTNLEDCRYEEIILNNAEADVADVHKTYRFHLPQEGGEYIPSTCNPIYKTAVIIPYRNRDEQLKTFLNYMHMFLQRSLIHYKIFIVEQNNTRLFNRAKMFNYGGLEAIKQNFQCLILQDVDLLPLSTGNIYACSKYPRHMSSCLDTFRFNLPYLSIFGGAVSIQSKHFKQANGMSNVFDGWGGEDDDFHSRLRAQDLIPYRFSPELSKYTMLKHRKEKASADRFEKLKTSLDRQQSDGLNSLAEYSVKLRPLYTHIYVNN